MAGLNERQLPIVFRISRPRSTRTTTVYAEVCHESPVLPEVGEGPSPRLQGRPSSRQDLRHLQVEPAFQGASALSPTALAAAAGPTRGRPDARNRLRAVFCLCGFSLPFLL